MLDQGSERQHGGPLTILHTAMQDAARWCLACSEKDGIQHKDANKSGDATLHRQGDLNDREACKDCRKRDSVATFEDPADMG